jgi:hypothetical protein
LIEDLNGALDRLIEQLRQVRADLRLVGTDFSGWSKGARFYPLLYMLTRVWGAKDWESGIELRKQLLGSLSALQIHHIFPKALLYQNGYTKAEVNAIANFTFLTQETNLKVLAQQPSVYLEKYSMKHPGAIESHWIPADRDLWKVENYPKFLEVRRGLLANAANEFLESLLIGEAHPLELEARRGFGPDRAGGLGSEDEERLLQECNEWLRTQGLPEGEFSYEITDEGGEPLVLLDLAWPNGLQEGLSEPVALLIEETSEVEEHANQAGFRFFTDLDALKDYVHQEILALETIS